MTHRASDPSFLQGLKQRFMTPRCQRTTRRTTTRELGPNSEDLRIRLAGALSAQPYLPKPVPASPRPLRATRSSPERCFVTQGHMLRLSSLTLAQNGALENTAKLANTAIQLSSKNNTTRICAQLSATKPRSGGSQAGHRHSGRRPGLPSRKCAKLMACLTQHSAM